MSKKAVYSNKGLQVYITKEDFENLLSGKPFVVPVFIGKNKEVMGSLWIDLSVMAHSELLQALKLEQQAVNKARRTPHSIRIAVAPWRL